ncbi:hypothetical protein H310_02569 [Aphanomyces invadans]|uniref:Uncharacterized protein n=1 Tax=Aphanomyces invadans TaxID=157072 RepID=A0A024UJ02_9STRA|nr:hypothetical protein H310_02569 [Aphanomyces invadans]ETW06274.1 hypothetical protein H310_02569 [Aphanomyces invadans]RHY23620.1 hypothetical protein DYB32_009113 [Aphanomyces invadans]|eukprot:XP_008864349.1 hypothetical protein H310_02569 [Aphanomyces invadans]
MSPARLRELEILVLELAPDVAVLDEFERQWEVWTEADASVVFDGYESSRYFGHDSNFIHSSSLVVPRSFRSLYWERVFRVMLATTEAPLTIPLHLFQNVVYEVKLRGNELTKSNVERILTWTTLHRIELHHVHEQASSQEISTSFWTHLSTLVQRAASLREIGILHSTLSCARPLITALRGRDLAPITILEFVSVTLRQSAYADLVAFVSSTLATGLRLSNSIPDDMDARSLLVPALRNLDTVLIEHADFDDVVLPTASELVTSRTTRLSLGSNGISDVSFLARCVHLVELDVSHNDLQDGGISSFATTCLPHMPALIKLFVVDCNFSSTGATTLLNAIASGPMTLRVLNAGRNFLEAAIQESVLAPFLIGCPSLECLHLNYIGLGSVISPAFCAALAQHPRLAQLSLGENRLRDEGAAAIFAAMPFPMQAVDLSGNLITRRGLDSIANHVTSWLSSSCSPPTRRRRLMNGSVASSQRLCWVEELNLRSNRFDAIDLHSTLASLQDALPIVYANEWRHNAVAAYDDQRV